MYERIHERLYVRLGKEFGAHHGRRGGGRRPPASRRGAGRAQAALEALLRAGEGVAQVMSAVTRDGREFTRVHERLGKKFSAHHGRRAVAGNWQQGRLRQWRRGVDWSLTVK